MQLKLLLKLATLTTSTLMVLCITEVINRHFDSSFISKVFIGSFRCKNLSHIIQLKIYSDHPLSIYYIVEMQVTSRKKDTVIFFNFWANPHSTFIDRRRGGIYQCLDIPRSAHSKSLMTLCSNNTNISEAVVLIKVDHVASVNVPKLLQLENFTSTFYREDDNNKLHDHPHKIVNVAETKVAVLIYGGNDFQELISTISLFVKKLDTTWKFQTFHRSTFSVDVIIEALKRTYGINYCPFRFIFNLLPENALRTWDEVSPFMIKNIQFWQSIAGDRILIYQSDTALCSRSTYQLNDFLRYDYIGAPWPPDVRGGRGGNGGLSIRSRPAMIYCSQLATSGRLERGLIEEAEDVYFSACVYDYLPLYNIMNTTVPSRDVQTQFALEFEFPANGVLPLGVHKPWKHIEGSDWERLVEHCPDADTAKLHSKHHW